MNQELKDFANACLKARQQVRQAKDSLKIAESELIHALVDKQMDCCLNINWSVLRKFLRDKHA